MPTTDDAISKIITQTLVKSVCLNLTKIYEALHLDEQHKGIVSKIMQDLENSGKIASISLCGELFYFESEEVLQHFVIKMENISKNSPKIAFKEAIRQAEKIIKLPPTILEEFLMINQNVGKYFFEEEEICFIHNDNLDKFTLCSSCGKVIDKNILHNGDDEWFCSQKCRETNELCLEVSENLNPIMLEDENLKDYNERLKKNLFDSTSTAANTLGVAEVWAKNFKSLQNDNTGHGFNAEIMNHENDIWTLKSARIAGGDNAKNGADRIVGDVEIQSKYLKTGVKSVNAAFDNKRDGNYRYYNKNGKPMVLEVPKEQYEKAIQTMEEKIRQGKVPGISDPSEAKNVIKKGSVTYEEAKNYSKFCSKESLKFDARNGAVVASIAFGVSFVINTSLCYYKEGNIKKALKESIIIGVQTGGKAFLVYMIGAQAQRISTLNHFLQQVINVDFNKNIVGRALARVAVGGAKEGVTKYGISINSAANSALRGSIISAMAMIAVTSSIEIAQMMKRQISNMQCVKNIIVSAGGIVGGTAGALVGATLGTSVLPIGGTFLGGLIGGIVGGVSATSVSKKTMDYFIKDDTLKKQAIFFDQMIVLAVLFKLTEKEASEFRGIVDKIVKDDEDFFGNKFHLVEMLSYSNYILKPIVVAIVSQRPKIPVNVFDEEVIDKVLTEENDRE